MASFQVVRPSKFRHLMGIANRPDKSYLTSQSKTFNQATDSCNTIDVNLKFLALSVEVSGGGAFVVIPLEKYGRVLPSAPRVVGHTGPVTALRWCPHNDNLIASASEDATVKLWHIPDGGLRENALAPQLSLESHSRKVNILLWHPTADGVLFSAGFDKMIYIWDVHSGSCYQSLEFTSTIYSMSLNWTGSLLATTSVDKKLRVVDPRTKAVLQETVCHSGIKICHAIYLGNMQRIATVGFGENSDRELAIWDDSDLSKPLRKENIDNSSGILVPFYDHDTKLLFIAGKGEGNIRFYELTEEYPYCHYLNQYISGDPQRGIAMLGKRGCKVMDCEIIRFYKLHATKAMCQPISMVVPRKQKGQFHPDLFPDTVAATPSLLGYIWFCGVNKPPVTMSLFKSVNIKTHRPVPITDADVVADKNATKKYKFLKQHTRADYRPMQIAPVLPPSSCEKDLKTSTNLDVKFQELQNKWMAQQRSHEIDVTDSPPKPEHTQLYNTMHNKQVHSVIKKLEDNKDNKDELIENVKVLNIHNEAELKLAYMSQCSEMKMLRRQLIAKDRQIRDLQLLVEQKNDTPTKR